MIVSRRYFSFSFEWVIYGVLFVVLVTGTIYTPYLTLCVVLAAALCVLIWARPVIGLILTVILTLLMDVSFTFEWPLFHIYRNIQAGVILIALIYFVLMPRLMAYMRYCDIYEKRIHLLVGFLFFWGILALFWSHDRPHGVNVLTKFLVCVFIFQMFPLIIKEKSTLMRFLEAMPWVGLALAIMLLSSGYYTEAHSIKIFKQVHLNFHLLTDHNRPGGFAPPDLAAAAMNIFIFFNIALLYRASVLKRILLVLLSFLFAYCMLLTASKAALGSLMFACILLMFTVPFFRPYLIHLSVAFFFSLFVLMILGGGALIGRINLVIDKGVAGFGLGERLEWWATGFQELSKTLGLGLGTGGYLKYIDPVPGTHSVYLSLLFDLGVVGTLIFIFIVINLFVYMKKVLAGVKDNELIFIIYCFLANLAAYWIQALVQGDFQQLTAWMTLALMVAVLKLGARSNTKRPETFHIYSYKNS